MRTTLAQSRGATTEEGYSVNKVRKLFGVALWAMQSMFSTIAIADALENERSIQQAFRRIGFTEIEVNGCVVHASVRDYSGVAPDGLIIYQQRTDLRTIDFSTLKVFPEVDGSRFIGDARFNELYHQERVKIAVLAMRYGEKFNAPWPDSTRGNFNEDSLKFEREMDELGIYFWNYQRLHRPGRTVTKPSFLSFYLIGEDEAAVRNAFSALELRSELPVCKLGPPGN